MNIPHSDQEPPLLREDGLHQFMWTGRGESHHGTWCYTQLAGVVNWEANGKCYAVPFIAPYFHMPIYRKDALNDHLINPT